MLVIASMLIAAALCYRQMGYVPWTFLIFMAVVYLISPSAFAVLVLFGAAAFVFTHLR